MILKHRNCFPFKVETEAFYYNVTEAVQIDFPLIEKSLSEALWSAGWAAGESRVHWSTARGSCDKWWPYLTSDLYKKKRFLVETHLSSVFFSFLFFFYALSSVPLPLFLPHPPPFGWFFIHCFDKCTRPFKITGAAPEGTVEQCDIPGNLGWLFKK